jgi:hypothetical protein
MSLPFQWSSNTVWDLFSLLVFQDLFGRRRRLLHSWGCSLRTGSPLDDSLLLCSVLLTDLFVIIIAAAYMLSCFPGSALLLKVICSSLPNSQVLKTWWWGVYAWTRGGSGMRLEREHLGFLWKPSLHKSWRRNPCREVSFRVGSQDFVSQRHKKQKILFWQEILQLHFCDQKERRRKTFLLDLRSIIFSLWETTWLLHWLYLYSVGFFQNKLDGTFLWRKNYLQFFLRRYSFLQEIFCVTKMSFPRRRVKKRGVGNRYSSLTMM